MAILLVRAFALAVVALGALAAPHAADAQDARAGKPPRIGRLSPLSAQQDAPNLGAFRLGLRDLGWVEGRDFAIEARFAEGKPDRLPQLANELISRAPDVIISTNDVSARALQRATSKIPIVMSSGTSDPVSQGFVHNLRRPEGNITGSYSLIYGLENKRLEILKEVMPDISRVGVLRHPPSGEQALPELLLAGKALRLHVEMIQIGSADSEPVPAGPMLRFWS